MILVFYVESRYRRPAVYMLSLSGKTVLALDGTLLVLTSTNEDTEIQSVVSAHGLDLCPQPLVCS